MAKKFNIEQDSGRLKISYNWRTPAMWFMLLWCIIWDGGMVFALIAGAGWFLAIHLLAGFFVTWFTLTRFLNSTVITVDRREMRVDHGPIPWPFARKRQITSRSLKQLYVDKSAVQKNNQSTYSLMAILDSGQEVKLINSEPDLGRVQALERTIEGYLEIENDTSLDLSSRGRSADELDRLLKGAEEMQRALDNKKWVPAFIKEQAHNQLEALRSEMASTGRAEAQRPGSSAPSSSPLGADQPIRVRTGTPPARALPQPGHDLHYPLFAQPDGTGLQLDGAPFRLSRSAQLDWTDDDKTTARQLELRPDDGGTPRYFYANPERDRWAYYEERRLDDNEVTSLGFDSSGHPLRFNNGDERYYPRDRQEGYRFAGGYGEAVEQYIYFTTSSSTQFRALKSENGGWEVYVMEPVDAGGFEERG